MAEVRSNSWSYESLSFTTPTDGLLYSVDIPSYIVRGGYGESDILVAGRITVTLATANRVPMRRRRSIVPVLHDQYVFDVPADSLAGVFRVEFDGPVRVNAGQEFLVTLESLHSSQTVSSIDSSTTLRYLECANATDYVYDDTCYDVYRDWRDQETDYLDAGCAYRRSELFRRYRKCLQISDERMSGHRI